ncbi:MAG: type I DNA topoisomerase [Fervidobacterium sp.]|nr:type I DNA topoisomerase [Fervidobacterium sp.]
MKIALRGDDLMKNRQKKSQEKLKKNKSEHENTHNLNASTVVIVESPAKAKTIENILGKDYQVISSKGHIRDLPQKTFGVDLESLSMEFEIIPGKESVVKEIRNVVEGKEVLLASDPDREGEAIAWHLATLLNLRGKNRITFSEITPRAIQEAIKSPREIDMNKVNAQLARRVLDRIVGYKISPLLWKILKDAKSAGRVQSAALKLVCERERERFQFVPQKYYKVWVEIAGLKANLTKIGKTKLKPTDIDKKIADEVLKSVKNVQLVDIDIKEIKKNPPLPFITSTLQQDASSKLGFPVAKTMKLAQDLYEGIDTPKGHIAFITYMRTDSTRISDEAKEAAEKFILELFGEEYLGEETKKTSKEKSKTKVQDAHECIRPVNIQLTPEEAKKLLDKDHAKLYELIWKRFIASQMSNAVYKQYSYDFKSDDYVFEASVRERVFDGFEIVYTTDNEVSEEHKELIIGESYSVEPKAAESETTPPDRYSEATLVKTLESEGIGRPSTYATIIQTLLDRKYVVKNRRTLVPTVLGFVVNDYLEKRFPDIVDKGFTAEMEKQLDEVENGLKSWKDVIKNFLKEFSKDLQNAENEFFTVDYETNKPCETCTEPYHLRVGKYGLYLNCPGCKVNKSIKPDTFGVLLNGKMNFIEIQHVSEKDVEEAETEQQENKYKDSKRKRWYAKRQNKKRVI